MKSFIHSTETNRSADGTESFYRPTLIFRSIHRRKRSVQPTNGCTEQEGPLPAELSTCLSLEELYLHCNKLCGEIPDALRSLRGLRYLYLHRVSRRRARTCHRRLQHKEAFLSVNLTVLQTDGASTFLPETAAQRGVLVG